MVLQFGDRLSAVAGSPLGLIRLKSGNGITFHIKKCSWKSVEAHSISRNLNTTIQSSARKASWKTWSEDVAGRHGWKAWPEGARSENLLIFKNLDATPTASEVSKKPSRQRWSSTTSQLSCKGEWLRASSPEFCSTVVCNKRKFENP